jgi:hypothetical protein
MLQIDAVVSAKLGETRGRGRSQPMVFNRQVAMYLASRVGRRSTTVIGRFYNHRDHSTVCYSIQKIEKLRHENPEIGALIADLEQQLHEEHSCAQTESNSMAPLGPAFSESQIESLARSAAEGLYRDFKEVLRRSITHLQPDSRTSIEARRPLPPVNIQVPRQHHAPQTDANE